MKDSRAFNLFIWIFALIIIGGGCGKKNNIVANATIQDPERELPLPEIPSSISDKQEQLKYITLHFWDALDFNDTIKSLNEEFIEQNFSNFAFIMAHLPDSLSAAQAAGKFLEKASVNQKAFDFACSTARHYLDDPNSPMRNEELWIVFLAEMTDMPRINEAEKIRLEYEHMMALKNRVGYLANDFEYIKRGGGKPVSLYSTKGGREGILLIFYDPDCETCKETIGKLRNNPYLSDLVEKGELAVLAVDAEDDREEWEKTAAELPEQWIVAFNTDNMLDRDAYELPATPVFYFLSPEYEVIAKDISFEELEARIEFLATNKSN